MIMPDVTNACTAAADQLTEILTRIVEARNSGELYIQIDPQATHASVINELRRREFQFKDVQSRNGPILSIKINPDK